ncbi:MAG: transcriptional regulator NanR [Acidobacteria bacterium]|nr:transcriptional regulator NanR [Acidobacteriota bacterium]
MSTQPIIRRKLADEVRDRLMAQIRSGDLHPGDRLPSERALMENYGVGRPAVREALQSLHAAGLIEITHGERARVAVPNTHTMMDRIGETMVHLLQTSPATLAHLKEARLLFEVGMAKTAAGKATPGDIQSLEECLERQRRSTNASEFVKNDMAFHNAIAAISGNSVCTMLSQAMLDWLFHFRRELLRMPGGELITVSEHEQLVKAIAAHDVAEAEKAMMEHLMRSSERYKILEDAMQHRSAPAE